MTAKDLLWVIPMLMAVGVGFALGYVYGLSVSARWYRDAARRRAMQEAAELVAGVMRQKQKGGDRGQA